MLGLSLGGGGLRLPTTGLTFRALRSKGLIDDIGILITRDQVDESIADIIFDGETKRSDAEIVRLALGSYLLNQGTLIGGAVPGTPIRLVAVYDPDTPAATLLKAYNYVMQRQMTVVESNANGTPVYSFANQVNKSVSNLDIRTLSAQNQTEHVKIASTGTECGAATISKLICKTTAQVAAAGPILIIGSDVSGTGNLKLNGSVIEYCDVYGSYAIDPDIALSTGLHGVEIGWNNRPTVRHCRVTGATYGIVLKGGSYDLEGVGGAIGNIITGMGNAALAPSDGITVKGLLNVPICHNFIYQQRNKAYGNGAIAARQEAGAYPTGELWCQNNIVLLDNSGQFYNLLNGATVTKARANLYYSASGTAFGGVSWATWLTNGRVADADFERGSMFIRNPSLGETWEIYNDEGVKTATVATNPLLDHFETLWGYKLKSTSAFYRAGFVSPYVNYSLSDFWGNTRGSNAPQIGPWQGS